MKNEIDKLLDSLKSNNFERIVENKDNTEAIKLSEIKQTILIEEKV